MEVVKMKIKLSELRKLIREAASDTLEIYNNLTGEIIDTLTKEDISTMASLGQKQVSGNSIFLDDDEYELVQDEMYRNELAARNDKARAEVELDNIDTLLKRLDDWAKVAAEEYMADNPGVDIQDVAFDLADVAEYSFEPEEWDELMWHFDNSRDDLRAYTMDSMS